MLSDPSPPESASLMAASSTRSRLRWPRCCARLVVCVVMGLLFVPVGRGTRVDTVAVGAVSWSQADDHRAGLLGELGPDLREHELALTRVGVS
jgi:hypothetical protein